MNLWNEVFHITEKSAKEETKSHYVSAPRAAVDIIANIIAYDTAEFEIEDGVLIKYRGKGGNVVIPNCVTSIGG